MERAQVLQLLDAVAIKGEGMIRATPTHAMATDRAIGGST